MDKVCLYSPSVAQCHQLTDVTNQVTTAVQFQPKLPQTFIRSVWHACLFSSIMVGWLGGWFRFNGTFNTI